MCFLGIRTSRQRHAAPNGSAKETGGRWTLPGCAKPDVLECCFCDARRSDRLSLVRADGAGCGIRRGRECVRPALRGAHTAAEIRGGVRSVLQACAEVAATVTGQVGEPGTRGYRGRALLDVNRVDAERWQRFCRGTEAGSKAE